jgi:hypothetical protein
MGLWESDGIFLRRLGWYQGNFLRMEGGSEKNARNGSEKPVFRRRKTHLSYVAP